MIESTFLPALEAGWVVKKEISRMITHNPSGSLFINFMKKEKKLAIILNL